MVWRKIAAAILVMCFLTAPAVAAEVEGIKFPDTVNFGGRALVFNGGGKRTFYGIGVYVAGLYLEGKSGEGEKIADADEPMDIRLEITSMLVTSTNMASGFLEAFKKSATVSNAAIKGQIATFVSCFKGLHNHDVFNFVYLPGKGVQVIRNDKAISLIQGLKFKRALFGIWLGSKPVQKDLKKRMLGK